MCMGMMNYRGSKESLTVIHCRKCGRAWQVTEKDAEFFSNHRGICVDCRKKAKDKTSLLKRKTNNDRINEMSVEEKAEFLTKKTKCVFCDDEVMQEQADCSLLKTCTEYSRWKQWLESVVEE